MLLLSRQKKTKQSMACLSGGALMFGDFFVTSGRPIIVDFSPVTDFREATCRQYEEDSCNRGGYCNFMHLMKIGRLSIYRAQLVYVFL